MLLSSVQAGDTPDLDPSRNMHQVAGLRRRFYSQRATPEPSRLNESSTLQKYDKIYECIGTALSGSHHHVDANPVELLDLHLHFASDRLTVQFRLRRRGGESGGSKHRSIFVTNHSKLRPPPYMAFAIFWASARLLEVAVWGRQYPVP